ISMKRWFAAKIVALGAFLGLFVLAISFFSLVIVPPLLFGQSKIHSVYAFWLAVLAHSAGMMGGALFATLFFLALQGVLINVLTANAFRRVSPHIQTAGIAVFVTLLLLIPLAKDSIPRVVRDTHSILDYVPT